MNFILSTWQILMACYSRARGRRSLGTPFKAGAKPTISHSQIGQLYAHVIKLSAENVCNTKLYDLMVDSMDGQKINSKNSWKLPLIDHIDSIINKDESVARV